MKPRICVAGQIWLLANQHRTQAAERVTGKGLTSRGTLLYFARIFKTMFCTIERLPKTPGKSQRLI
jgi:hypothetical protein